MVFGIVCAILVLILSLAAFLFCRAALRRPSPERAEDPHFQKTQWGPYQAQLKKGRDEIYALPHERVYLENREHLHLAASFFPAKESSNRAVILVHGFHTLPHNNFTPAFFSYYRRGFHILMIDQRAHGASRGRFITYGERESGDVCLWANYLADRLGSDTKIVLHGVSMGAATVMLAAPKAPQEVCALVADCGFTTPYWQFTYLMHKSIRILAPLTVSCVLLYYRIFTGCNLFHTDTKRALAQWTKPTLILHGLCDDFVPAAMSKKNFAACAARQKELVLIPNAAHAMCFLTAPKECDAALLRLLRRAHLA